MANFAQPQAPPFSVDVYQNEYLPEGAQEVNAIVTVTATGGAPTRGLPVAGTDPGGASVGHPGAGRTDAAVVIMIDCSGSMDHPPAKMRNARAATAAATGTLHDGVSFAVVAGTHKAKEIYPGGGRLGGRRRGHPRTGP